MADYLAACDVVVGKAGPASVMEALAVGRPVLAVSYAGLNEVELVRFLEHKQLGAYVPRSAELGNKLDQFADISAQQQVRNGAAALGLAEMTRDFGSYLAEAATHGFPETSAEVAGVGVTPLLGMVGSSRHVASVCNMRAQLPHKPMYDETNFFVLRSASKQALACLKYPA